MATVPRNTQAPLLPRTHPRFVLYPDSGAVAHSSTTIIEVNESCLPLRTELSPEPYLGPADTGILTLVASSALSQRPSLFWVWDEHNLHGISQCPLHPDPVESVAFWPLPEGPRGLSARPVKAFQLSLP